MERIVPSASLPVRQWPVAPRQMPSVHHSLEEDANHLDFREAFVAFFL